MLVYKIISNGKFVKYELMGKDISREWVPFSTFYIKEFF
jgi:hypothetical protein